MKKCLTKMIIVEKKNVPTKMLIKKVKEAVYSELF